MRKGWWFSSVLVGIMLLPGCVHSPVLPETASTVVGPYPHPSGRILLLGRHRAQLLFACQKRPSGGICRFTHGASGRVMVLRWQGKKMWQRSNDRGHESWQTITMDALRRFGMVVHPETMMQLLNGVMPLWLHPVANNRWQGRVNGSRIQVRWQPDQQRLDLINLSKGAEVRLLLDHGEAGE